MASPARPLVARDPASLSHSPHHPKPSTMDKENPHNVSLPATKPSEKAGTKTGASPARRPVRAVRVGATSSTSSTSSSAAAPRVKTEVKVEGASAKAKGKRKVVAEEVDEVNEVQEVGAPRVHAAAAAEHDDGEADGDVTFVGRRGDLALAE